MDPNGDPTKNTSNLHRVLAELQTDAQLVFAGSGESVALFLRERREAACREESLAA